MMDDAMMTMYAGWIDDALAIKNTTDNPLAQSDGLIAAIERIQADRPDLFPNAKTTGEDTQKKGELK